MKRFFSLLALVVAPVAFFAADAKTQDTKSSMCDMCGTMANCFTCGPVSAADESWSSRVKLGWAGSEHHHEGLQLNTIQPFVRSDDMRNTGFVQAGAGFQGHDKKAWDLGLGYRYLTVDTNNMFGANMFYNNGHHDRRLGEGYRASLEWLTSYTTLTLGRQLHDHADSIGKWKMWNHLFNFEKAKTTLDLAFQLPYLPWTTLTLGKDWKHHGHHKGLNHLNYILDLNLLSCVSLQMGYMNGWNKNQFMRLAVTFGRSASVEHTLFDKFFSDEAFSARDLRNYTLQMVAREDVGLYR